MKDEGGKKIFNAEARKRERFTEEETEAPSQSGDNDLK